MMTPVIKTKDPSPSTDASTKCLNPKRQMNELDEAMLEIAHLLDEMHKS